MKLLDRFKDSDEGIEVHTPEFPSNRHTEYVDVVCADGSVIGADVELVATYGESSIVKEHRIYCDDVSKKPTQLHFKTEITKPDKDGGVRNDEAAKEIRYVHRYSIVRDAEGDIHEDRLPWINVETVNINKLFIETQK